MADVVFFYKVVNNHVRLTLDSRQKFGFIKRVDKGEITTVKDLES